MKTPLQPLLLVTVALAGLLTLIVPAPAVAQDINRGFEEAAWDRPPSETEAVAEELVLVDLRTLDLSRTDRAGHGFAGKGLNVRIPAQGFRGFGPLDRLGPFDDATQAPDEVWYRYHINLTNWSVASSGKLPGLAGLYSSSGRGCIPPSESARGWSARGMFDAPGTHGAPSNEIPIGTYLYHADQEGDCGDGLWWGASLEPGRWHCVEGHVRMNDPGQNNGIFQGWLDGKEHFRKTDIQYRRAGDSDIGVRHMWHNVYFGGSWPTPNPLSLKYDEVAVSTWGKIGCMSPFTDIGQTMHSASIRELHALGYMHGCGYREACPTRMLSRGEAAALISRILNLPGASKDYFEDDENSTYEGVINRLAQARIATGCNPPANNRYCPDRTMTRAEFASVLTRGLGLQGPAPDVFSDDDGHWGEQVINQFAQAGITKGCGSDRFCPDRTIPRAEAAAFFHRSLGLLQPLPQASSEPPADWPPEGDPPPIPPQERD